jgi:uncharacterized Zn finger protein (UPF0148 family)
MASEKRTKLIKAKCPNCKASLLVRPSVTNCPVCETLLRKPGKNDGTRRP